VESRISVILYSKLKLLSLSCTVLDPDVHDMLTQSRSKPKTTNTYEVERTDKGPEGLHWQMIESKPESIHLVQEA
jgi:hypothetical protein